MVLVQENLKQQKTMTSVLQATLLATMAFTLSFYLRDTISSFIGVTWGDPKWAEGNGALFRLLLVTSIILVAVLLMSFFWDTT